MQFLGYHEKFIITLQKHLGQEFEVQIREGFVTVESQKIIGFLKEDFISLQVGDNVEKIFVDELSTLKNQDIHDHLLELLMGEVMKEVLWLFDSTLSGFQIRIKKPGGNLIIDLLRRKV